MDKFTELVGSEITALFLKPTQETQEVLQRVVHLLNEAQTIDIPYNHCHLNGVEFGWKVRGIRDQVIALLGKSKQPYVTEWVGLTEEEIKTTWSQLYCDVNNMKFAPEDRPQKETVGFLFARAIEAKLKERNT